MITRQLVPSLTILLVFIFFFSYGEAVICYQCNSAFDPRCGDPFDSYTLGTVNCSFQQRPEHLNNMEPTVCRKLSQKVYGKVRVVRGCGYITDQRDNGACARRSGTHDVLVHYCSCTTDLCNSATKETPFFGILLVVASLFYISTTN